MSPSLPARFVWTAGRAAVAAALPCLLGAQVPGETVTTLKDQRELAVTVYNTNLALVRDLREVKLPAGDLELAFQEVSAQIRPETALLRNLSEPKNFWVYEQNFDFDLLTPQKLLDKYVGAKVTVVIPPAKNDPTARERREEAEVLSTNNGVVLKFPDRIETAPPGRIVFPGVPANLRARPTLVLELHSGAERVQKVELTYLTGGLSWQADYVANLSPDEKALDLAGWVTLTNQSGAAYPRATLQLVAGDVHRVEPAMRMMKAVPNAPMGMAMAPQMREEGLFEYHLYSLDRPTTLKDNQTKQVSLLSGKTVPVRKDYLLKGESRWYQDRFADLGDKLKVGVYLEFENKAGSGLGLPLPKGVVRVYQRDSGGRAQFVGEDSIDHTPVNEKVRLKLGDAFDVTARRRQTDFKSLGKQGQYQNVYETAFQLDLQNAKKEPVTVTVLEPLVGDWEIFQNSQPFTKETSTLAKFLVPVQAEGKATLTYRARVRW